MEQFNSSSGSVLNRLNTRLRLHSVDAPHMSTHANVHAGPHQLFTACVKIFKSVQMVQEKSIHHQVMAELTK